MPTLINGTNHDVDPKFVESVSARVHVLLQKGGSNRLDVGYNDVVAELTKIFPGIQTKPYYKDLVMQFCRDRKIPVRKENL